MPYANPRKQRSAVKKLHAARRLRHKLRAIEYLGGKCEIGGCGTLDINSFHFDHIPSRGPKVDNVAKMLNLKWERIVIELDKCQLLCIEHHIEVTNARRRGDIDNVSDVIRAYLTIDGEEIPF